MKIILKNKISYLNELSQSVDNFTSEEKVPPEIAVHLNLILEELFTNIVNYGFKDSSSHEISINLDFNNEKLSILIIDDGIEFDPFQKEDPDISADLSDRPIGGLGIYLVKNIMDGYSYIRENGENIVSLHKHFESEGEYDGDI